MLNFLYPASKAKASPPAQARTTLAESRDHRGEERRAYRRTDIALPGKFMISDSREYPCETVNISAGGVLARAVMAPEKGEKIVLYIDKIGRMSGVVKRTLGNAFAIGMQPSSSQCDRLIERVMWLSNQNIIKNLEQRRHPRVAPHNKTTTFTLPDNAVHDCEVIDISLGGVSIKSDFLPEVNSEILIGQSKGTVIRHHECGFAVELVNRRRNLADQVTSTFYDFNILPSSKLSL